MSPVTDDSHQDRARAESFGSIAEQYDRVRPTYPDALIADIAGLGGTDVIDVGCGTGIAARLLMSAGLHVLGVEVDPAMAAVARRSGVEVETGSFETWDDAGRRFDLLTCGQAWHWIDPQAGARKAATVLRPGGTLCLFWNEHAVTAEAQPVLDRAYEQHAPELIGRLSGASSRGDSLEDRSEPGLTTAGFGAPTVRRYDWQHVYDRDVWLELLSTFSDHHLLPAGQRSDLLTALGRAVDELGGRVTVEFTTHALFATRG